MPRMVQHVIRCTEFSLTCINFRGFERCPSMHRTLSHIGHSQSNMVTGVLGVQVGLSSQGIETHEWCCHCLSNFLRTDSASSFSVPIPRSLSPIFGDLWALLPVRIHNRNMISIALFHGSLASMPFALELTISSSACWSSCMGSRSDYLGEGRDQCRARTA